MYLSLLVTRRLQNLSSSSATHSKCAWLMSVLLSTVLGACGGEPITCDEPQRYQASVEGAPIVAPDDLDELQANDELIIPEVSPREPRPKGSPCLERPPAYVSPNR